MFLWIATSGYDEPRLLAKAAEFAALFRDRRTNLRWHDDGVATLELHLAAGHRVVVVTAAPACLAEQLLLPWASDVEVIGSSLTRVAAGWIGNRHCRGIQKCLCLADRGFGNSWNYFYSVQISHLFDHHYAGYSTGCEY